MKFKQLRKHLNEVNGQEGPVLRMSYKPQRASRKLPSHSTITKSDLYDDVVYNSKNWEITANTNSLAIRIPSPKGHEKDRQTWMDLIDSAKGDTSNMIRGGGLTQSEVDELARDMEKAAKDFKATTMVSPDIRAGVSLLIAALAANGESTIHNVEQIDRGYQNIEIRLNALGAKITRIE